MSGQATRTIPFPIPTLSIYDKLENPTWIQRRLLDLGIIKMPNALPKPPGFYVNFTTIAALTVIIGFIAGGFWWTWQQGKLAGYEAGKQETVNQQLQQQLDSIQTDAKKAKDLAIYNSRQIDEQDGHAITPKTQKRK